MALVLLILVTLAGYRGAAQASSIERYGPTSGAFVCVLFGSLIFYFAVAILSRFLPEPRLWASAINGAIYAPAYWYVFGLSTEPSKLAVWTALLLPALALLVSSLLFRDPNPAQKTDTPPEGGAPPG